MCYKLPVTCPFEDVNRSNFWNGMWINYISDNVS